MIALSHSRVQGRPNWRGPLLLAALLLGGAARADDAAPRKPDAAQEQLKAARAARRAGDEKEAERLLKECERLKGPAEAVALERKLLAAQRGDVAGVEKELIAAVQKKHPDAVLILEALAQGYHEACRPLEEHRALLEWLLHKPDDPQALYRLGRVIEQRARVHNGNWNRGPDARALEHYRRAVKADPKFDAVRLALAEGLLEQNNADEALKHFQRLRERRPKDRALILGVARCEILLGRTEEGTKLLDRLLADDPGDARALAERGRVALQEEQVAKAEGLLRQALKRAPADYTTTYRLSMCLKLAGKENEAQATLARLKRLQADRDRLNDCLKATERTSQDPAPRAEAGAILLRIGQEEEGLRWLRSALRADPKHKPTHRALADYYQRKGDKERAAQHQRLAQ